MIRLALIAIHISSSFAWLVVILFMFGFYVPTLKKYREYMFFENFHIEFQNKINRLILFLSAFSFLSGLALLFYYGKSVFSNHLYGIIFHSKMILLFMFLYLSLPVFKTQENEEKNLQNFFKIKLENNYSFGDKNWKFYLLSVLAFFIVVFALLLRFDNFY